MLKINLILRIFTFLLSIACFQSAYAIDLFDEDVSFAEQYKDLRILLQKVTSAELATSYKAQIDHEIDILRANQTTSPVEFKSLSDAEKKLFIKKFQQNRFHCGEVTAVADERRRILLHPELSSILRDSLNRIP